MASVMTPERFAKLQEKNTSIQDKLSRNRGARDQLREQLHEIMGDPKATKEDAEDRIEKLEVEIEGLEERWKIASEKLEAVTDWNAI